MTQEELKGNIFIAVIEDNNDPKKLGRVRARVASIFDNIPLEDIPWAKPWKDLNGNQFSVPEIGKIVSVVFEDGSIYKPEYIYAEHFNINLENKLNSLSGNDYTSMRAVIFDQSTQVYRNESEGLKLDHEYTNINLDKDGNILLNLRDNKSVITMGSVDADEEAVLGTTFMKWVDTLVDNLMGTKGGPYLGNLMSPVIPNPALIKCLNEYKKMRPKFVSEHVRLSKNKNIIALNREYINQRGDKSSGLSSTLEAPNKPSSQHYNEVTGQMESYQPLDAAKSGNPANYNPGDYNESISYDIPTTTLDKSKYQNGRLPADVLMISKWANGDKAGKWTSSQIAKTDAAKMVAEAAKAFDALFDAYELSTFDGKSKLSITDGYRTYQQQVNVKAKMGSFAAEPGTSNHGWGIAMDISGIANPIATLKKNTKDRASAYRTPTYQWLFQNGPKFGIYSPLKLRDGSGIDEWWHFEYQGNKGPNTTQFGDYTKAFSKDDVSALRRNGVSIFTPPSNI